jgi:hypothetical protein
MKYLLAAEADRIQDLLFRSSKLREVAGGSLLLSRFCEEMPELLAGQLGIGDMKVITHGGGSFYLTFDTEANARRFGPALAEVYARALGGTLSYAEPVGYAEDPEYVNASKEAGKNLRQAKRSGAVAAMEQMPYIAFCESCGVGLAEAHEMRFAAEDSHYYCHTCRVKAAEYASHHQQGFLQAFNRDVIVEEAIFEQPDWQDDKGNSQQCDALIEREGFSLLDEPEDIATYDARNYVAYIVADGNGMGKIFSQCNAEQAKALSQFMDIALRRALAKAMRVFRENQIYTDKEDKRIPAMPLIMGGDDLFALVPAPFALDIAGRMCAEFQAMMTSFVDKLDFKDENGEPLVITITMSAAVVICKANYPYYLAHALGEDRLGETKRIVKALAAKEHLNLSAVDFEVVYSSQLEKKASAGDVRATLRPYWVTDHPLPEGWGLNLQTLLDARRHLAQALASRRRSQLRALFDDLSDQETWNRDIKVLLARIEPGWENPKQDADPKDQAKLFPLATTLKDLGGIEMSTWLAINRLYDGETWQGHGIGDLLRFWDWTLDLDRAPDEYEGGVL